MPPIPSPSGQGHPAAEPQSQYQQLPHIQAAGEHIGQHSQPTTPLHPTQPTTPLHPTPGQHIHYPRNQQPGLKTQNPHLNMTNIMAQQQQQTPTTTTSGFNLGQPPTAPQSLTDFSTSFSEGGNLLNWAAVTAQQEVAAQGGGQQSGQGTSQVAPQSGGATQAGGQLQSQVSISTAQH